MRVVNVLGGRRIPDIGDPVRKADEFLSKAGFDLDRAIALAEEAKEEARHRFEVWYGTKEAKK